MSDSSIGNADRKWLFQGLGLTVVVIVLAILFSLINPKFATITNFLNVLTQASYYIILAVGMTFVIAAAGIELSVGSLLALITVVNFELIKNGSIKKSSKILNIGLFNNKFHSNCKKVLPEYSIEKNKKWELQYGCITQEGRLVCGNKIK